MAQSFQSGVTYAAIVIFIIFMALVAMMLMTFHLLLLQIPITAPASLATLQLSTILLQMIHHQLVWVVKLVVVHQE